MPNSTQSAAGRKSARFSKPSKGYPLYPNSPTNPGARWCKKVRGKLHYFGKCADDPKGVAALEKWLDQKDALLAGRTPRGNSDGLTLEDLCERFLAAKDARVETGELTMRTFEGYRQTCQRIVDKFGKRRIVADLMPEDFAAFRLMMARRWGAVGLGNEINRVRIVFRFAHESDLIDKPVRFGPEFKRPSKKTLRIERANKGERLFSAEQIRAMLDGVQIERDGESGTTETVDVPGAGAQLRAMIMLGINCGFGNSDIGNLPIEAVDLQSGWVNYPRPKTGIDRRCKLWPETVAAIETAIAARPEPKGDTDPRLLFITRHGQAWAKETADSPVTKETRKLLGALEIHRKGLGFYTLRHTFATVGGETTDQVAVNAIMGHVDDSMAAVYRERISDERLAAVADHVRGWLFGEGR